MRVVFAACLTGLVLLVGPGCGPSAPASDGSNLRRDGAAGDAMGSGAEEFCRAEEELCGGAGCVDTRSDPDHCGECNRPCPSGSFCSRGDCTFQCAGGLSTCDRFCVDLAADANHCGDCNLPCEQDETCRGGACVCRDPLVRHEGRCIDTTSDASNCGIPGRACDEGKHCVDSSCVYLSEVDCLDGEDEDMDGDTDCADDDCAGTTRSCEGGCDEASQTCLESGRWGECGGCPDDGPPPDCTTPGECGAAHTCVDNRCVFDEDSQWDVVVVDAEIPGTTYDGSGWDWWPYASPDPYVQVTTFGLSGRSATRADTYQPQWDEKVLVGARAGDLLQSLRFTAFDEDGAVNGDDVIGECAINGLARSALDGPLQLLECPADGTRDHAGFRLRFRVRGP